MTNDTDKGTDKSLPYIRDDINSLRRDILDMRDNVAVRSEKSVTHLSAQTTLIIIALILVFATAIFAFLSANRTADLKTSLDKALQNIQEDSKNLAQKYADAIEKLKSVELTRDELARKLASNEQELTELRFELSNRRSSSEREMLALKKKCTDIEEEQSLLKREAKRADALSSQLVAFRDESSVQMKQYEDTIKELQERITQFQTLINMGTPVQKTASGGTVGPVTSIQPSATKEPERSLSPDDIKKMKEREFDDL